MSSRTVRLLLVRHGEVAANRDLRYLGRRDDPLTETGRRQARAIADALAALPLDLVLTSPMSRTRATAAGLEGHSVPIRDDARLIELDFGAWEGLSRRELVTRSATDLELVEAWESDPARSPPGGESLVSVQARITELADELLRNAAGATVALVTHMGPVKALLCAALGLPLERCNRIFLDPATISVVDWGANPVVRLVNGHVHLGFEHARWLTTP